ncbi:MAG: PIN domain-containing protein [Thermoguttaceae bacterium]|jgi:predicted nucleic acid-binding protein|nr:PIN domain-containing protein [Thermoguttaceae bacterium]
MKPVFVDTVYYLALTNPRDQYAKAAIRFTSEFSGVFVTTAWVLAEVANSLTRGPDRSLFYELYRDLVQDRCVTIVPADDDLFQEAIGFFADRPDKEWSLTDCISFLIMQKRGLTDALTADHHFEQTGFKVLLK